MRKVTASTAFETELVDKSLLCTKLKRRLEALLLSYEIVKGFIVKNAFLSVVLAKNCSVDPLLYVITHLLKTMLRYKISLDLEF